MFDLTEEDMRTILAIFARDVRRIVKSPVALVVTCGVALIPSLYAWCNILANWDPYANTGNIQVAVANEDLGTDSTLGRPQRREIRRILCGNRIAG